MCFTAFKILTIYALEQHLLSRIVIIFMLFFKHNKRVV